MKSAGILSSLLLVGVVFAALLTVGDAYGTGAPATACGLARPMHVVDNTAQPPVPIEPQTNVSPYTFTVEVSEYNPGGDLEVTIVGAENVTFQGFLLQARTTPGGDTVGTFTTPIDSIGKLLQCTNAGDTVTHSAPTNKTSGQTFTWHTPAVGTGSVQFIGTVAENHDVFYSAIMSETLTEGAAVTTAKMTTSNAFKLFSGFGILLLATSISMLQIFV